MRLPFLISECDPDPSRYERTKFRFVSTLALRASVDNLLRSLMNRLKRSVEISEVSNLLRIN